MHRRVRPAHLRDLDGLGHAMVDNLAADHGGWLYQNGAKGPDIFGMTAWFRVHLMGDTANRKYFYGPSCTFCSDSRVTVMRNALLTQ